MIWTKKPQLKRRKSRTAQEVTLKRRNNKLRAIAMTIVLTRKKERRKGICRDRKRLNSLQMMEVLKLCSNRFSHLLIRPLSNWIQSSSLRNYAVISTWKDKICLASWSKCSTPCPTRDLRWCEWRKSISIRISMMSRKLLNLWKRHSTGWESTLRGRGSADLNKLLKNVPSLTITFWRSSLRSRNR